MIRRCCKRDICRLQIASEIQKAKASAIKIGGPSAYGLRQTQRFDIRIERKMINGRSKNNG